MLLTLRQSLKKKLHEETKKALEEAEKGFPVAEQVKTNTKPMSTDNISPKEAKKETIKNNLKPNTLKVQTLLDVKSQDETLSECENSKD